MLAFDKTFNDRVAPVKGSGKVCSFYKKNYILVKPRKQASIWLSLSWWLHKLQNITAHYYILESTCTIIPVFHVSVKNVYVCLRSSSYCWPSCCSFMSVVYTKNKNSELLLLINLASQKGKRIAWICNYMKIWWDFGMETKYLFKST